MDKETIEQVLHEIEEYFYKSNSTLRDANNLIQTIYETLSGEIKLSAWQPDWSRIPDRIDSKIVAWEIDSNHQPVWVSEEGVSFQAPLFGYVGSRQDSRRERL